MTEDILRSLERAEDGPEQPLPLFQKWLADATPLEPNDPNAMALATIDASGRPSLRIVLLKSVDDQGFVFFTNRESRKGEALKANPAAALCFHWKSLRRQVRIEGPVERVSDAESDAYYTTRPLGSRLGAWASQQSRPLESRSFLANRVASLEKEHEGQAEIPRPPYWGGYRVRPNYYEFWHDGAFRLHTRLVYELGDKGWTRRMIYP
jgi:pyridoxamine 5'-phosphate oxidase